MHSDGLSGPAAKIVAVSFGATAGKADLPMTVLGFTVSDWAAGLTAIYVIFQIVVLLPAVAKTVRGWVARFRVWRKGR